MITDKMLSHTLRAQGCDADTRLYFYMFISIQFGKGQRPYSRPGGGGGPASARPRRQANRRARGLTRPDRGCM